MPFGGGHRWKRAAKRFRIRKEGFSGGTPPSDRPAQDEEIRGHMFWARAQRPIRRSPRLRVSLATPPADTSVEQINRRLVPTRFIRPWRKTLNYWLNNPLTFPTTTAGADSIRFYFTGAGSDGGVQTDPDSALGSFRSSTEDDRVSWQVYTPIPNVQMVWASRYNGIGAGSVQAVGPNTLAYTAPGSSTLGPAVDVLNGVTVTLKDGDDSSKWVRATRTSTAQLAGTATIDFLDIFNNAQGMLNAAEAESSAGGNRYRSAMLRNDFTATVDSLQVFIKPLIATNAVSSGGGLPGAGAGTITGATDAFCGWVTSGWVRIENSGGSLKEHAYFSSRTDTVLTVPALGRARLGSAATAGAATDKIWSVPGIRVGFEIASPKVNGSVQSIANESTAPNAALFVGGAWSTAITAATGVQAGTFNFQEQGAIWIHRELPAGVGAIAQALNLIGVDFKSDAVQFHETLAGMFKIADDDLKKHELHIGVGAEPDLSSAPTETRAYTGSDPQAYLVANPWTPATTLGASTVNYVIVNTRNEYNLVSQNALSTIVETDGAFAQLTQRPAAPTIVSWLPSDGGKFRVLAYYDYTAEPTGVEADEWKIYFTSTGVAPVPPASLLATVTMVKFLGRAYLDYTTAGFANGTTGKLILRVNRTSDSRDSNNSDVNTATAETGGPAAATGVIGFKKLAIQEQ